MLYSNIKRTMAAGVMLAAILTGKGASAQLNPLSGIYFSNQYLGNPAMAGQEQGLRANFGFRQQWSTLPGSPKAQSLTGEYGFGKKVGLGLNLSNDEAGLIKQTRVMGTYAYHLPFDDEGKKLSFGVSLGFMNERVMNEVIDGDQNDLSVSRFNRRDTYIDGDFGAAFTTERLTIQAAIPNLKQVVKKDDAASIADQSTFFSAISYKLDFPNALDGLGIEPKVAFRGVKGFDNLWDAGANITVANKAASVMAVYHSSQSATIGLGALIRNFGSLYGNYTTNTAALAGYTNGNFELSLRADLSRKKKDKVQE